jgi:sulfur carrier protein
VKAYLRVSFFVLENCMIVTINGQITEVAEQMAVHQLINDRKLNQKTIILELNGLILKPDLWKSTLLNPNDKLEIIRIIGGG